MKLAPYPKYKDSGIEWLGEIPEGWEVKRLKYISLVRPSNVDKKTEGGETEIRLCNYIDVYNNESIDDSIDFMIASATFDEIKKFRILRGDVLITKDSEEWDDIAVPSFVKGTLETVICGYHLALVRPKSGMIDGKYLFRTFQSYIVNSQFRLSANGITRYGLSKNSISSAVLLVPSLPEQQAIANFLDHKTSKIDELIKKNEKLIELLKEKRQAIISHAATKGLDPNAKMKGSGIKWLGEIPEGWETFPIKQIIRNKVIKGIGKNLPLLSLEHIVSGEGRLVGEYIPEIVSADEHATFEIGNVLFGKLRPYLKKYYRVNFNGCCPTELMVFSPNNILLEKNYLFYLVQSNYFVSLADATSYGVKMPRTSWEAISSHYIPIPKISEQHRVVEFLDDISEKIDETTQKIKSQIETLKEYRQALISNVVTGKVKINEDQ